MTGKPKKDEDTIIDYDQTVALFNGTPEQILQWFREHPDEPSCKVAINNAQKIVHDHEYIEMHSKGQKS